MQTSLGTSLAHIPRFPLSPQLLVGVLWGKQRKGLTELIARFALCGQFHFVIGGEWLPDQDSLHRAVRWYTTAVKETLDRPILGRPATCLQLRDQLTQADTQPHPILILDFLHHFFDPDVDISLRRRVLEQCCRCVKQLSATRPVFVLVRNIDLEEYQAFFPMLADIADEIIEEKEDSRIQILPAALF